MKQNSRSIVDEVAKSSGVSFDELDCAIESFSAGVVDSVFAVIEQARQMSSEYFDYLLDGFQTTAHGVVRPGVEETLSGSRVVIAPELSERFFDTPCSAGLEVELIQGAKRNCFRRATIGIALEPRPFATGQRRGARQSQIVEEPTILLMSPSPLRINCPATADRTTRYRRRSNCHR
jgi:hypothetical protein